MGRAIAGRGDSATGAADGRGAGSGAGVGFWLFGAGAGAGRRSGLGRRCHLLRRGDDVLGSAGRDLQPDQLGPHRQHAADLAAQGDDGAGDRRRNLDRRLVGHDGGEDLVLQHRLADLDVPFDDLGLGDALADIGHLDDPRAHLRPPSRP